MNECVFNGGSFNFRAEAVGGLLVLPDSLVAVILGDDEDDPFGVDPWRSELIS